MRRSTFIILSLCIVVTGCIALCFRFSNFQPVNCLCINELMACGYSVTELNSDEQSEWIELYNGTKDVLQLKGYGLSNNPDEPFKYTFPETELKAGEYLLVYAGISDNLKVLEDDLYTGFHLSSKGGTITLTSPDGMLVDEFEYQECYNNVSYGRALKNGKVALLNKATPGLTNVSNVSKYILEQTMDILPEFSHEGGFYEGPITLTMDCSEGYSIYYTLDGSVPNYSSELYERPILLENPSDKPNRYANRNASKSTNIFLAYGQSSVKKAVIVRARLCKNGQFAPSTKDATFFLENKPEINTISLITDPENLFDNQEGIYVGGFIRSLFARTQYNEEMHDRDINFGNYSLTGETSLRPVHIEMYSGIDSETLLNQSGEMSISGGLYTSAGGAKSLRLYATTKYGDDKYFSIPFFKHTETTTTSFRQLVIRTNSAYISNGFSDAFCTTLFLNEGLAVQAYEPVAVYLNGEYWGCAELRERLDETMIADHYGLDKKDIVLLKSSEVERMEIKSGTENDRKDYLELYEYAAEHDMTNMIHYQYLAERIDLDNFIRNYLAHIYFGSCDWPDNNVRAFRTKTLGYDNSYHDGKWRFPLYDMDTTCEDYKHNTLLYALGREKRDWENNEYPAEWSTQLFAGLMDNATFRKQFLDIYQDYRQTIFQPSYLLNRFDEFVAAYGSELKAHNERWTRQPTFLGKIKSIFDDFEQEELGEDMDAELTRIRTFLEKRLPYMDKYMEEFYAIKGEIIKWE